MLCCCSIQCSTSKVAGVCYIIYYYVVWTCFQVFFSVLQGAQNVGLTAPHLEAIACARASAAVIYGVLDRKPEIDSLGTQGTRPDISGDIELRDVHFRYPARPEVKVRTCREHFRNRHYCPSTCTPSLDLAWMPIVTQQRKGNKYPLNL